MFSDVNCRFKIKITNCLRFQKTRSKEEMNEDNPLSEKSSNKTSDWFIALESFQKSFKVYKVLSNKF